MRLIGLAAILALSLALAPLASEAQQTAGASRVGLLFPASADTGAPYVAAFRQGLREGLEVLKETVPTVTRVAILVNPTNPDSGPTVGGLMSLRSPPLSAMWHRASSRAGGSGDQVSG